ncbi:hypothetical protein AVEN_226333-1 [Araneus ventricosus]|uniref:Uncharacterized protein n=1 Tax=Araneus ventricosus TaxID=182803 RepID=A0A4Y2U5G7_ARAVE|nr:hypothetical protein AVEN_226333-1 [Araneus ventricosus]
MHKGKIPISMLWIKFQTEYFERRVTISSNYGNFVDISDIELLLKDLKLIFNFSSECYSDNAKILKDKLQGRFCSTGMPYSKTFDNCEEIKTNDLRIQNLRISETFCNEIPNSRNNFETQHQGEILTSSKKRVNHEIMDKIENFENVKKGSSEIGMPEMKSGVNLCEYSHNACNNLHDRTKRSRFKTDIEDSTKIADLDFSYDFTNISIDSEGEKGLDGIFSPKNVKRQSGAMKAEDVLSANQQEESEWPKLIAPKNLANPRDFCSENEIVKSRDERESSSRALEPNFYSKYKETYNQNTKLTCALTVKEMAATQSEKNEIPNNLSSPKDFLTINEVTNSSDGRINTNMELDKLREEQEDPGIGSFLRMIMVLGDRQGIQCVRETLCSNEEDQKNTQLKSNKRKYRSKNHSTKCLLIN